MSDTGNPFAPPQAEVADVGVSGLVLAKRGNRLLAAIADTAIQVGALVLVNLLLPWSLFDQNADAGRIVLNLLVSIAVFAALQGTLLVRRGQTLGKILLGVRIVRPDGSRAGAARLLGLRYLLGFVIAMIPIIGVIYGLVDSLLIFRESRRCLHDQIADTIVVQL